MSTFDYLFSQGMQTSLTSTKLYNGATTEDDFIHFDTPDTAPITIKNELLHPQGDDPLRSFQDWSQLSLKTAPPPTYLQTYSSSFETSPFESPLQPPPDDFATPFTGNFDSDSYQSPFDSPLFNFEEESNLPPTPPQFNSPEQDEGYGTGNSKAFLVDFGFSPEQLNYKNDFPFEPPIFESSNNAQSVSGSLFLPIEDLTAGNNLPMIHPVMVPPSSPVSSDDFPPANNANSPKRKRSVEENNEGRNFACEHPYCGRVFARLFNLHTHEKTHDPNRDKPYVCTATGCVKSFARKHDLFRHETSVHDGLRDYKCDSCSKLFSRKDALRRHLAVKGCTGV